jgi:hypothetical protein
VLLDLQCQPSQPDRLVVSEHALRPGLWVQLHPQIPIAGATDNLMRLVPDPSFQQPGTAFGQEVGVRFNRAADHHLAEPASRSDH